MACVFFEPLLAANNYEIRQELKALGNMFGYSLDCASDRLGKNVSDPEQAVFVQDGTAQYWDAHEAECVMAHT